MTRPISTIADEIRRDWKNVYFGAVPYLNAMASGQPRRVKKELKAML